MLEIPTNKALKMYLDIYFQNLSCNSVKSLDPDSIWDKYQDLDPNR